MHSEYLANRAGRFSAKQGPSRPSRTSSSRSGGCSAPPTTSPTQAVADYLGINRTDARCLEIIERLGGVTAGRLARESGLSTGAVTTVLDRLERSGLARRTSDPDDRRRVLVEIDPGGARGQRGALPARWSRPPRSRCWRYSEEELALLREYHRASRALTEAHAERVRGLLSARAQEREAASS